MFSTTRGITIIKLTTIVITIIVLPKLCKKGVNWGKRLGPKVWCLVSWSSPSGMEPRKLYVRYHWSLVYDVNINIFLQVGLPMHRSCKVKLCVKCLQWEETRANQVTIKPITINQRNSGSNEIQLHCFQLTETIQEATTSSQYKKKQFLNKKVYKTTVQKPNRP